MKTFAQTLVALLKKEFDVPFVKDGLVRADLHKDGSARIQIGPRDVTITKTGRVTGAGTCIG